MPPKANLTREMIAEKAFDILRNEGYEKLNARYLATSLGVSTMPLFHYYENMDEIKKVAVDLGVEKYTEYIKKGMEHELPFKGVGRAYIQFAKDEPELFKIFFMTADDKVIGVPRDDPNRGEVLDITTDIMNGNKEDGSRILKSMWLFVHGVATLEATGKMSFSDDELSQILSEAFSGLKSQIKLEDVNE